MAKGYVHDTKPGKIRVGDKEPRGTMKYNGGRKLGGKK